MSTLLERLRKDPEMIRFGELLMQHDAKGCCGGDLKAVGEQFVRGLEAQLAAMPAQIAADAKQQRQRRGRMAARCRKLAGLLDRDPDSRWLTIFDVTDHAGLQRIRWTTSPIKPPRPTLADALNEAAQLLERTPSYLRPVKLPRDLVLAVADRLEERLAILERCGHKVRHTRPLKAIAAISSVLCGRHITVRQAGEFIKRRIVEKRKS